MSSRIKTPCIGICSTGISDLVCRGCKRFAHEVIDWNRYDNDQRRLVIERLDGFIQQIVENKLEVFDEQLLLEQMHFQQIKVDETLSSQRWLYELLRTGANQIDNTEVYGFRIREEWQRFSLDQIRQFLDQDFYTLSCAHYERYFTN